MVWGQNISQNENETLELGFELAQYLKNGDVVAFYGDLGAGKTEFIKGICKFYEVKEIVTSPTFTIMNHYNGKIGSQDIDIYHIDLYRINSKEELIEVGFRDCVFSDKYIKLIEWAEKAEEMLPKNHYIVEILTNLENLNYRTVNVKKNKPESVIQN